MKKYILLILFVICLDHNLSYALSVQTHQKFNEYIAKNNVNGFSLDSYLKNFLGLENGINESFNNIEIWGWFRAGGEYEDVPEWYMPYLRSVNHFHNPTAPNLDQAGFSGIWDTNLLSGTSAILWSQSAIGTQSPGGFYSWYDTRNYFYTALSSTVSDTRNTNFAQTFRGLGQLMHLVQDMSVPEHSRNSGHYADAYEEWVRDSPASIDPNRNVIVSNSLANPIYPDTTILNRQSPFSQAPVPIANLFDTNQYDGSNPALTVGLSFGLSEYSNVNFFCKDTIFRNGFLYPAWSSVKEFAEVDSNTGKTRTYLSKVADGELIGHAARGTWFFKYLPTAMKSSGFGLKLDEKVYADYASLLLPRAVGYSAALLDYFFRGNMNISVAPGDITFHSIKVTASNSTLNDAMVTGDVSLVIRYKALPETNFGPVNILNYPSADYSYIVANIQNVNLSSPQHLTFDFSNSSLPMFYSDMTMQLVFKGTLGNENGAVAVSQPVVIDGIYSDFDLSIPTTGVYAKTSDSSTNATFSELHVNALSNNPGGLSGGTISLALEYRTAIGNQFQSVLVDTAPANAAGYVFRTPEKNNISILPQGVPVELTFDLSSLQLPVAATDIYMNVVYSKADGTIQAIGVNDISEPTPVDVFNNTDYTCLNSTWYRYDDPAAMAIVDSNGDGIADKSDIYPHAISNIAFQSGPAGATLTTSPTQNNLYSNISVQPGQMLRLGYILTDYSNSYTYNETWTNLSLDDMWEAEPNTTTYQGAGFQNQADKAFSSMYTIRGNKMWWGAGIVYENPSYSSGSTASTCDWSTLP